MFHLLVRHHVADYHTRKAHFDNHAAARRAAGLSDLDVWRGLDEPNHIFILMSGGDVDKARAFASSFDLQETMERAGVTGRPDACFLQ